MKNQIKGLSKIPIKCYCGSDAYLQDSTQYYGGKVYGNGMRYICERFPECRGSVGTHPAPGYQPLGSIPDPVTRRLRIELHAIIDPIWRESGLVGTKKRRLRGKVYKHLAKIMNIDFDDCHVGLFDAQQCKDAMKLLELFPFKLEGEKDEQV